MEFWYAMANANPQRVRKLESSQKWLCLHATLVDVVYKKHAEALLKSLLYRTILLHRHPNAYLVILCWNPTAVKTSSYNAL